MTRDNAQPPFSPPSREFLTDEEERQVMANRAKNRADHLDVGRRGEQIACRYLFRRGFRVIERNCRVHRGEIDIIAEKRGRVHFIEVKTRTSDALGAPEEKVDREKREMIRETAQAYLDRFHDIPRAGIQFDVLAQVLDAKGQAAEQKMFHNAF